MLNITWTHQIDPLFLLIPLPLLMEEEVQIWLFKVFSDLDVLWIFKPFMTYKCVVMKYYIKYFSFNKYNILLHHKKLKGVS